MLINQKARLAANSLRQRRPNQGDRNKIATILEECATALEEMEPNADAKDMAEDRFPKDTVEQEAVEAEEDGT